MKPVSSSEIAISFGSWCFSGPGVNVNWVSGYSVPPVRLLVDFVLRVSGPDLDLGVRARFNAA